MCLSFSFLQDEPVLLTEDVLLLLLAAMPLALVIQWCSSAGKLSDPTGSLDAPRGSLRRGETAQHASSTTAFSPIPGVKRQKRRLHCYFQQMLYDLMSSCTSSHSPFTKMRNQFHFLSALMDDKSQARKERGKERGGKMNSLLKEALDLVTLLSINYFLKQSLH